MIFIVNNLRDTKWFWFVLSLRYGKSVSPYSFETLFVLSAKIKENMLVDF